ncbi:MAG: aromatic ring-hydroxylating oxygenase subunit alpha [Gammaproteobacteria bacterium]
MNNETVQEWVARIAVERARNAPPIGFPELPDLPAGRYTNADFFALERERIWRRIWLYAGHVDQLSEPGSYFIWSFGSAPIVIMRGDDGEIRGFYNTCRHRGAPVVRNPEGCAGRTLVCGYHGWSYDRQGRHRGVTERRDWSVDMSRDLVPVRCERFANWVFVCEDPAAESLSAFLEPVARFLRHLPLVDLRLVNRRTFDVRCNVKLLIDNFLEAYHFKLLHPRTSDRIFDNQGTSIHLWRHGHSMMLSPNRRDGWVDPGTIGMPAMASTTAIERHHNPSYCLFPNLIVPISPTGMPCVAIWPKTLRTSVLEVLWFAPDWGGGPRDPLWDTRIANFDRIVEEDIQFAEPMQATIESPGFRGVPLSYQERRIYHWHEEVDRRIGIDRLPLTQRITPCLEPYVE